jgi:dihydroxyacetone kinase-like protein
VATRDDIFAWLKCYRQRLGENKDYLTRLDSAIGDADHGANMDRGFAAVMDKLPSVADKDIGAIFKTIGMTLVSTVGGAGGPLYGTWLHARRHGAGCQDRGDGRRLLAAFQARLGRRATARQSHRRRKDHDRCHDPGLRGHAGQPGRRRRHGAALEAAAAAAEQGMKDTIPMLATKGRASYLGERSIGHQDPGATSSAMLFRCAADMLGQV